MSIEGANRSGRARHDAGEEATIPCGAVRIRIVIAGSGVWSRGGTITNIAPFAHPWQQTRMTRCRPVKGPASAAAAASGAVRSGWGSVRADQLPVRTTFSEPAYFLTISSFSAADSPWAPLSQSAALNERTNSNIQRRSFATPLTMCWYNSINR